MGTVNKNIKGLVGHKGDSIILTRGIEFPVLNIFRSGENNVMFFKPQMRSYIS